MAGMNAVEMFNELVRQGYVVPVGVYPDLMLPTAQRSVPTMIASGTGQIRRDAGTNDAKLDRTSEGNITNTG